MAGVVDWEIKRVVITARTYPTPSQKDIEVSCTAGITDDGKWIRLYPIPYRFLEHDKWFRKYQTIQVRVAKSSDSRPESYKVDTDSIRVLCDPLPSAHNWQLRKDLIYPLRSPSLCHLQRTRAQTQTSLGFFKPKEIMRLEIEPENVQQWTAEELQKLQQTDLFRGTLPDTLEKIPYKFFYHFKCEDPRCTTHRISCVDWETGQSWRSWRTKYGADWESAFRETYERKMIDLCDTHFSVGTMRAHPDRWIIIGLFYPKK